MSTEITIFSTNDIHGRFLKENNAIDFSRLATLKAKTPNCLLVDAGDATQGTPFAIAAMGIYPIEVMNCIGYDFMTVGNHEFDNITRDTEVCELDKIIDTFKGTYLAANLMIDRSKDPKLPILMNYINTIKKENNGCYAIKNINGKNLLFIGVATPDMSTDTERMKGFKIGDIDSIAKKVKQIIDANAKNTDAVIVIAHLGNAGKTTSTLLAQRVPEIDLIIDGHSHEEYIKKPESGKTLIVQAGCYGQKFSKITLKYDNNKPEITAELLDAEYLEKNAEQNEAVTNYLKDKQQKLEEQFGTKWSTGSRCTLWGGALDEEKPYVLEAINIARYAETNLGELIAEAMVKNTITKQDILLPKSSETNDRGPEYVVAAINGGSVRASIPYDKPIRSYELFTVMPSPLESVHESGYDIFRITLGELKTILENSVSKLKYENGKILCSDGRFLNVSGLQFSIEYNNNSKSFYISDTVLLNYMTDYSNSVQSFDLKTDSNKSILFCTTKYLGGGGDGYETLKKKTPLAAVNTALFRIVGEYIWYKSGGGALQAPYVSTNTIYLNFDCPKSETVDILLVDKDSNPLKNQLTAAKFNGEGEKAPCSFFISDEDGCISVTPPDGSSILELLVMLPFNAAEKYNSLYCELYFHTYYMPNKPLTARCLAYTHAPLLQEKMPIFQHTRMSTGDVHYSNYLNFIDCTGAELSCLIYNNELYVAESSEGIFYLEDSVDYKASTYNEAEDKTGNLNKFSLPSGFREFSFIFEYETWGGESYRSKLLENKAFT